MGRRAFTISLLAFLGFVVLQTVSADEPSEELAAQINSNAGALLEPSENQFRLIRSPEADKKEGKPKRRPGRKRPHGRKGKGNEHKKGKKTKPGKEKGNGRWRKKGKKTKPGKEKGNGRWRKKGKKSKPGKEKGNGRWRKKDKKTNSRKGKDFNKLEPTGKKNKGNKNKKPGDFKLGKPKPKPKQTCDEKELCKRIKLYIKYSNQQRKAKRILRTCKTMKNKHDKAATEFEATAKAIKDSDDTSVEAIQATLEKCKDTAKAACATSNVEQCSDAEQTKINECVTKLKTWIDAFGPGTSSCLGKENCCSCINAISPAVPDDCLSYDAVDKSSLSKKNLCTKSEASKGATGSFGECRKKQQLAAEQGPPAFGKKCGKGMTTVKPSGRRRKAVLKMRKELNIKK